MQGLEFPESVVSPAITEGKFVEFISPRPCCLPKQKSNKTKFAVPWGCLRFVIVAFPDHTHLLFILFLQPRVTSEKLKNHKT